MQYLKPFSHRYLREKGNFHCDTNTSFMIRENDVHLVSRVLTCDAHTNELLFFNLK